MKFSEVVQGVLKWNPVVLKNCLTQCVQTIFNSNNFLMGYNFHTVQFFIIVSTVFTILYSYSDWFRKFDGGEMYTIILGNIIVADAVSRATCENLTFHTRTTFFPKFFQEFSTDFSQDLLNVYHHMCKSKQHTLKSYEKFKVKQFDHYTTDSSDVKYI